MNATMNELTNNISDANMNINSNNIAQNSNITNNEKKEKCKFTFTSPRNLQILLKKKPRRNNIRNKVKERDDDNDKEDNNKDNDKNVLKRKVR